MRALISDSGTPVPKDVPRPSPGPGELLVRVRANSLNRADLMMLKGTYLRGFAGTGLPLGLEWAGEVAEVGPAVENWRVGARVMGAGLAAFAEYTIGYARRVYAVPDGISFDRLLPAIPRTFS
jgi:NADPH2:quinone reductase